MHENFCLHREGGTNTVADGCGVTDGTDLSWWMRCEWWADLSWWLRCEWWADLSWWMRCEWWADLSWWMQCEWWADFSWWMQCVWWADLSWWIRCEWWADLSWWMCCEWWADLSCGKFKMKVKWDCGEGTGPYRDLSAFCPFLHHQSRHWNRVSQMLDQTNNHPLQEQPPHFHQNNSVHLHGSRWGGGGGSLCWWRRVAAGVGAQLLQKLSDAQWGPHLGARQADLLLSTQWQQLTASDVLQEDKLSLHSDLLQLVPFTMEPFLKTPPHPPPKKEKNQQQKSATVVSKVGGGGGGGGGSKEKMLLKDGQSFIMCLLHCITNHIPGVINAESEIHSPPLLPAPRDNLHGRLNSNFQSVTSAPSCHCKLPKTHLSWLYRDKAPTPQEINPRLPKVLSTVGQNIPFLMHSTAFPFNPPKGMSNRNSESFYFVCFTQIQPTQLSGHWIDLVLLRTGPTVLVTGTPFFTQSLSTSKDVGDVHPLNMPRPPPPNKHSCCNITGRCLTLLSTTSEHAPQSLTLRNKHTSWALHVLGARPCRLGVKDNILFWLEPEELSSEPAVVLLDTEEERVPLESCPSDTPLPFRSWPPSPELLFTTSVELATPPPPPQLPPAEAESCTDSSLTPWGNSEALFRSGTLPPLGLRVGRVSAAWGRAEQVGVMGVEVSMGEPSLSSILTANRLDWTFHHELMAGLLHECHQTSLLKRV